MSTADEITKLASLRDNGILTQSEFETAKARAIAGITPAPATRDSQLGAAVEFEPATSASEVSATRASEQTPVGDHLTASVQSADDSRNTKRWVTGALAGVVVLLLVIVGVGSSHNSAPSSSAAYSYTPSPPLKVVYKLTGSTDQASITYQTPSGSSQQSNIDVPMTPKSGGEGLTFTGFSSGDFIYFSAQNSEDYGSLTCSIEVDGVVAATNTASGAYAIATCSGAA